MVENDWRDDLASFLEDLRVIEGCKGETPGNFKQFCEFIAEPCFESLSLELRKYGIRSRFLTHKGKWTAFEVNFPKSRLDNFHYIICLPKNSLELKLKLRIKGRKNKKSPMEEKVKSFMENVLPSEILKLPKEELIQDVIKHYKDFSFEAFSNPE